MHRSRSVSFFSRSPFLLTDYRLLVRSLPGFDCSSDGSRFQVAGGGCSGCHRMDVRWDIVMPLPFVWRECVRCVRPLRWSCLLPVADGLRYLRLLRRVPAYCVPFRWVPFTAMGCASLLHGPPFAMALPRVFDACAGYRARYNALRCLFTFFAMPRLYASSRYIYHPSWYGFGFHCGSLFLDLNYVAGLSRYADLVALLPGYSLLRCLICFIALDSFSPRGYLDYVVLPPERHT